MPGRAVWEIVSCSKEDRQFFIYHADWHASHYVKVMLDQDIRGRQSSKRRLSGIGAMAKGLAFKSLPNNHDTLFLYGGGGDLTFQSSL